MNNSVYPPASPVPPPDSTSPGGVRIGGDAGIGGDLAGRDVIKTTAYVGFSPAAVQRLLITVGVMIFVTAACFFSGGVIVGGAAIAALYRPVSSENLSAALALQSEIEQLRGLPSGERFHLSLTEEAMSSYVNLILGPQLGLSNGKVRLLNEESKVVVGGQMADLGGLPVAVVFSTQYGIPAAPLRLEAAAVQVLPTGKSSFGWVAVPPALLMQFADSFNQALGGNYSLSGTSTARGALEIDGVIQPLP